MLFQTEHHPIKAEAQSAPVGGALPAGFTLAERAVGALRGYLQANGIADWHIFHCDSSELHDIDEHIEQLGEEAVWETPPGSVDGGEALSVLTVDLDCVRTRACGFLNLRRSQVVLARWYWPRDDGAYLQSVWLCAVPSADQFLRLHERVLQLRRENAVSVWQIVTGDDWAGGWRLKRAAEDGQDLVLPQAIRQRVEADIVGFFGENVATLYRALRVPYRRGVLLYGPPGNGKTSLIRHIGAALPKIPVLVSRPCSTFDSDDLQSIVDRWVQQAPAILVIEDLDWLLSLVNISRFLNMIDGVESRATGGLLLTATTNHPEALDPAINNRPGRFDVAIE
ncbi:MAG: AAA family ATPase, partial [Tepidisphaeraceae bacterium]